MVPKYLHLKLDKFVAGQQQRIFKTTDRTVQVKPGHNSLYIDVSSDELSRKNIYMTTYAQNKSNKKEDNKFAYLQEEQLINFHDINIDYILNHPERDNHLPMINTHNSPWFHTSIINNMDDKDKQKDERISYFPKWINTPIDIAYSKSVSFFLLPLSTDKYINVVQSNQLYNIDKNMSFYGQFKPHYKQMIHNFIYKSTYGLEDNTIPIYDMNFSFLETIYLGSTNAVQSWINSFNLNNIYYNEGENQFLVSQQIQFNSETNKIDVINPDSILFSKLLSIMINNDYLFGDDRRTEIVHSLISNLNINSTQRFLNPLGHISKVADEILSTFINDDTFNKIFTNEQVFNVAGNLQYPFTSQCAQNNKNSFTDYCIPQNTLISYDLQQPLIFNKNFLPSPEFLPSGYFNILHLKNNRDPHFDIKVDLFEDKYNVPSFISRNFIRYF